MNLFETRSILNENTLKELKMYFITPMQKACCFFGIALSVYFFDILHPVLLLLFVFAFIAIIPFSMNRDIKLIVARMQESTNAKEYEYTTSFGDDGLKIINHSTNATSTINYDNIKRFVETKNYYALFTGANQFILVNKKEIDQAQVKEEFISFIKSHCKNLKKAHVSRKMWVVLICLACVFVAIMYWENGRTIFESHAKPSEAELETVREIIAFEQQKLSECKELLLPYEDRARELGIEIRPVLRQTRAVNHQGLVENHDWINEMWLPKYYSSQIICAAYKDGEMLKNQTSTTSWSYFVDIFWLVNARKDEDVVEYNENPFNNPYKKFDSGIESLLEEVSDYIQGETAPS